MHTKRYVICAAVAVLLLLSSCATSPDVEERRQAMEADVDEILGYKLDPVEFGEPKRCLSETEYRNFRSLGDRHILFEGRRDKQWVNVLRGRCVDLRHDDVLVVKSFSARRMCDGDRFTVAEWFDPPSRGRWPSTWGSGPSCVLGDFIPVAKAQVEEIEARLEAE